MVKQSGDFSKDKTGLTGHVRALSPFPSSQAQGQFRDSAAGDLGESSS